MYFLAQTFIFFSSAFAYVVLFVALGLLVASYLPIPTALPYRAFARPLSIVLLCFSSFLFGVLDEKERYAEQEEEHIAYIKELESKASQVTVKVVTEYKDRVKIIKEKGDTIYEQVPIFISEQSDNKCILPNGFVSMHNAAVQNIIPDPAAGTHDEPSGIKLSDATKTITLNYQQYHVLVEQLSSLQKWVKEMQALYNN